ncbi:TPA: DUF551 domain-containing protein [Serratia marcescens]
MDIGFMRPLLVWRGYWIDGENVMSGWIKCSERMPRPACMVLVYGGKDYEFGNLINGNLKIFHMGEWMFPDVEITHWMPLSEPPTD